MSLQSWIGVPILARCNFDAPLRRVSLSTGRCNQKFGTTSSLEVDRHSHATRQKRDSCLQSRQTDCLSFSQTAIRSFLRNMASKATIAELVCCDDYTSAFHRAADDSIFLGPAFNAYHDAQSLFRTPTDTATAANIPAEILLVIDSGYSHTTVTPVFHGRPLHSAVRRLDVGGKLLTNYMARQISLRHFDVRSDPHIVNEMKELACFVSLDFKRDLERSWKGTRGQTRPEYVSGGIAKDYILPDFHKKLRGSVRDFDPANHTKAQKLAAAQADEDVLTLRNERFAIPEILFNPSDIGMRQPGIADLIHQSLQDLPVGLWPGLLANIVLVGGNALFDGFVQRLQKEVVQRVPDDCVVRVARPADPILSTWAGAANLACHADIEKLAVTKQQYDEYGQAWLARKFLTGPGTS